MMRRRLSHRLQALTLALLLAPAPIRAQTNVGQIAGRVTDSSGAVLPGVTVTATSERTSLTQTAVTDPQGSARRTFLCLLAS